jgi:hypothetical protein
VFEKGTILSFCRATESTPNNSSPPSINRKSIQGSRQSECECERGTGRAGPCQHQGPVCCVGEECSVTLKVAGTSVRESAQLNISNNISLFMQSDELGPTGRNVSFDYCFNYFQSFRWKNDVQAIAASENIEFSCLQLGFYLASWEMLRGRSFLLQRSSKHYQKLIENLVQFDPSIWDIDVDNYGDPGKISLLLECGNMIAESLREKNEVTGTLKTKIMLGVFGNTPAFDRYFPKGLGVGTFCKKSLKKIFEFYSANKNEIDRHKIHTLGFLEGEATEVLYPRAKIIDMIGLMEGFTTKKRS